MDSVHKANLIPTAEEQVGLVCYINEQRIVESRRWNSFDKASSLGATAGVDDVRSVDMCICQAPPSFRQPVTQKKACTPPFKIQISLCFGNGCSQLPVKVNAYSLTADSLASFMKQASLNTFPALPTDSGLANASIYKCLENRQADCERSSSVVHETFEFVDMHFKTSSRMALRWLLFVARVKDDILCVIYRHPTIVLSRKTDQFCKALTILADSHPLLEITDRSSSTTSPTGPSTSPSYNKDSFPSPRAPSIPLDVKEWIVAAYNECHFSRPLLVRELGFLGTKLGITDMNTQTSTSEFCRAECERVRAVAEPWTMNGTEQERQRFEEFAKWYLACLVSLKRESVMWCAGDVWRICPFMIDRSISEGILGPEPAGTFVVRISSEPGSFVLSVKEMSQFGEPIEHVLIDALDLKRQSLASWIMANPNAQYFLDVRSGAKYPKHFIFIESMSSIQPHLIKSIYATSNHMSTRNVFPSVFDSATDSEGSSSPLNRHNYSHLVFGTSYTSHV